jgi:hypothetical protein
MTALGCGIDWRFVSEITLPRTRNIDTLQADLLHYRPEPILQFVR